MLGQVGLTYPQSFRALPLPPIKLRGLMYIYASEDNGALSKFSSSGSSSRIGTPFFDLNRRTRYPLTKPITSMMKATRTTVPTPTEVVGGSYTGAGGGDTSGSLPGGGGGEDNVCAGGGLSRCGEDGGSGGWSLLLHALGGPDKHEKSPGSGTPSPDEQAIAPIIASFPSLRWYLACHAVATLNIFSEDTSEIVFQFVISTSNAEAIENIFIMLWTRPTSQRDISSVKASAPANSPFIVKMLLTSQSGMSVVPALPQSALPEEQHCAPVGTATRHPRTAP